ncbi:MAG: class I SAM-dependent methyltransferase, partial [Ignavibacteria bacterium]
MRRTKRYLHRQRAVVIPKKPEPKPIIKKIIKSKKKVKEVPVTDGHKPKPYKKRQRWDAILDRLPKDQFIIGAEIGVLNGNTSHRLLYYRPLLTLIMIDPWDVPPAGSSYAKQADTNATKSKSAHIAAYEKTKKLCAFALERARIYRNYSHNIAPLIKDHSLDFVFIDGDHSYEGCKNDIKLWISKVKPGGFISGHDIYHPKLGGVEKAVFEFFTKKQVQLDYNRTWF